jgi:hypothetical protein
MSRTRMGSKGSGYEYWSRRPSKGNMPKPGKASKRITHRLERAQASLDIMAMHRKWQDEQAPPPRGWAMRKFRERSRETW